MYTCTLEYMYTCTLNTCTQIHVLILTLSSLRYLVTSYMQSDLDKAIKLQPITDDQVQLLVYQILRGLKVTIATTSHEHTRVLGYC